MLIDEIRALQVLGALPDPWTHAPLERALVVRMDDVYALVRTLGEDVRAKSFDDLVPNVAPLAPVVWCEVAGPDITWAAFLLSLDVGEPAVKSVAWSKTHARYPWAPIVGDGEGAGQERIADLWARTRWTVAGLVPIKRADGRLSVPRMPFQLWLDSSGRVCFRHYAWNAHIAPDRDASDEEMAVQETMLNTAMVGICFAHCKGVTLHDQAQPRQQRRAAERAGRPPLVTYKTIDIAPATRILRDEGAIEKTGITQALHICRGHFAHYTADAPLFGKHTGTFYRPMHVRGTLERGAVVKDYRVLPGEENAGSPASRNDVPRLKERQDQR